MLFADKRALETDLKLGLLEIREKELNFYTTNCANLAFLASIFAGFASTALMTHVPKEPIMLHFLYLLVTVAALGLQLAPGLPAETCDGHRVVAEVRAGIPGFPPGGLNGERLGGCLLLGGGALLGASGLLGAAKRAQPRVSPTPAPHHNTASGKAT